MKKSKIYEKIIIGIIGGIVCGLFSTGGGMILVPAFTYLLGMNAKKSRGTSIFCILPMVITSSFFYYKGDFFDGKKGLLCALGGVIGGYIGAKLLKKIPDIYLKIIFTIFLVYMSFKLVFLL